jgi:hypothetical protein
MQHPCAIADDRATAYQSAVHSQTRVVGFAYAVQLTMVGFLGAFLWHLPRLIVPALAAAIAVGVWQFLLPRRLKAQRATPLVLAIVALLVSIAVLSLAHPTYQSIFADTGANVP